MKSLTFFVSFVLVYYLIATTIRRRDDLLLILRILTVGGASIGALAVYELRTHYNLFNHIQTVLPFLKPQFEGGMYLIIGGNIRAVGPSQQPIALGAALVLILPLAIYFALTSGRRWWIAAILLALGTFASGSRTAIVMLAVVGIVFLCLKPTETKRLWPALLPAVVVIHLAVPGQLGGFKDAFFPKGGLIAPTIEVRVRLRPASRRWTYSSAQAHAFRSQPEATVRRRPGDEDYRLQHARAQRPDP